MTTLASNMVKGRRLFIALAALSALLVAACQSSASPSLPQAVQFLDDNLADTTRVVAAKTDHLVATNDDAEKRTGQNSLRLALDLKENHTVYLYQAAQLQDWSAYQELSFWWHGGEVGTVALDILAPDWNNYYHLAFTDDLGGWRQVELPLGSATAMGKPSWTRVRMFALKFQNLPVTGVVRIDDIKLQLQAGAQPGPTPTLTQAVQFLDDNLADTSRVVAAKTDHLVAANDTAEKRSGQNSLRLALNLKENHTVYLYQATETQDWSAYREISFWWYGGEVGTVALDILAPDWNSYYHLTFTDDSGGWREVRLPLASATPMGEPSWKLVQTVALKFQSLPASGTVRLDDIKLHRAN